MGLYDEVLRVIIRFVVVEEPSLGERGNRKRSGAARKAGRLSILGIGHSVITVMTARVCPTEWDIPEVPHSRMALCGLIVIWSR